MKVVQATYLIRLTLGQYQHEEISVTMEPDIGETVKPEALIEAARKAVISQTTEMIKRKKEQEKQ